VAGDGFGAGPRLRCGAAQRPVAVSVELGQLAVDVAKRNLSQLTALVKTGLRRMQYRPGLLDGFLARTRLGLTPFCNPPAIEGLLVA
jgi:hypothetical protein